MALRAIRTPIEKARRQNRVPRSMRKLKFFDNLFQFLFGISFFVHSRVERVQIQQPSSFRKIDHDI